LKDGIVLVYFTLSSYEWRDIKTHLNYAYVVTEGTGSGQGLQIIDLSNLPTSVSLITTIDTWFNRAHDILLITAMLM